MLFDVDEVSVLVERRLTGLMVVVNVPESLAGPAAEMVADLRRELGPGGTTGGIAVAAGLLAGLIDGAHVSAATYDSNDASVAA